MYLVLVISNHDWRENLRLKLISTATSEIKAYGAMQSLDLGFGHYYFQFFLHWWVVIWIFVGSVYVLILPSLLCITCWLNHTSKIEIQYIRFKFFPSSMVVIWIFVASIFVLILFLSLFVSVDDWIILLKLKYVYEIDVMKYTMYHKLK